jgi:peptide/nickel transport system permease protein
VSVLIAVPLGILAATRPNSLIDHTCRVIATAGVSLPVFFTGLILVYVFYYLLGWAPAAARAGSTIFFSAPPHVTGFYLIDSLVAGKGETCSSQPQAAHPAGADARHLLAGADRAHDPRLHAGGAARRFRAYGARQRPDAVHVIVTYAFRNAMLPVSPRSAWCSRSCSAPTCWSRRCSPGPASAPSRSRR